MNSFILLLLIFSITAYSTTHDGVKVKLKFSQFSEEALFPSMNKRSIPYLTFAPEEVYFPNGSQRIKFEKALEIMELVMNSQEFRQKVLTYQSSNGLQYEKNFLWSDSSKKLSNADVYQVIMNGNEKMRPGTIAEMNFNSWIKQCSFFQRAGTWCRSVIGSTEPSSSKWITLNWKFYSYFDVPDMVANMVHEWLHLLGFLHGSQNLGEEVPYVVGEIAGEVAADILNKQK